MDISKKAIQKAQEYTLEQNRTEALNVLIKALETEVKNLSAQMELRKALTGLSEVFYTEKGQRIFENAKSLLSSDIDLAIEKLNEAQGVEAGNLKISKELARAHLTKGDCAKSLIIAKESLQKNPYSTELFVLRLQSKVCAGAVEDFDAETANPYIEKELALPYFELARTEYLYGQDKYVQAAEALGRVRFKDSSFPESYYWKGMIKLKQGQNPKQEFEKYLLLCKEALFKIQKKFPLEPRVCRQTTFIEKEIEKWRDDNAM